MTTTQQLVQVTEHALEKMQQLLAEKGEGAAIRLGVVGGGCAGLQYDMQPTTEKQPGDFIQTFGSVTLYIHPVAAAYLKGTTVDYSDSMMDGGFKFINPNAANTCGCGTSFGIG
ncbi:MAG: HesB/IscA family protein [Vampirovibrionales bacterium]